ncbi:hypothetical protein [Tenacibaculum sp. M341]|uniref:hypothetical protein n=1 Tax=Tenacibaculum sp. M341 TaxID=2530339 RepID=UPI00104CA3CD|nr:hypothetical protein [Tenacibaculum sp. M341]TCI84570.1 hypothetical protein EYW44_20905 [Tenacibaculum sp. M341]
MIRKIYIILILSIFSSSDIFSQIDADSVMGLPTVTDNTEMNSVTGANTGSVVYNIAQRGIFMFDGTNWISTSSNNWLINGNNGTTSSNFLGTIDDVKMEIRSNNLPMLEFGRRGTLNLDQTFLDYNDVNQPLVHLNGNGTISALQFAAAGASFYKPMFFTTTNGSFRLKGSSGGTDLFEIGSSGDGNNGQLDVIIGDDGAEPISFKRFDYRNQSYRELFRVQGHADVPDAKTRFGININPNYVAVDPNYNQSPSGYNIANSTLQVQGSVSKSITTTTGNLTLTEDHYSIIINGNHTITLPNANTCLGREYILKNVTSNNINISNYLNLSNNNTNSVAGNSTLSIQSDGTNWHQMSNENNGSSGGGSSTLTYIDKFNNGNSTLSVNGFNTNGTLIPLNSVRVSNGSVNNINNSQVQITEAGLYEISYSVSILKASNFNRPSFEVVVCENNNPIANTGAIVTLPGANSAARYANASRTVLLNLNQFQSYGIKIRGINLTTLNVVINGNASGMTIKKIN